MSYYGNTQYGDYFGSIGSMGNMSSTGMMSSITGDAVTDTALAPGYFNAFGTGGYPGEPSLLEELGVNFGHISQKTKAVLYPLNKGAIPEQLMEDSDLAGPILFFLLFGTFLRLGGKSHFGYIYGLGIVGTLLQYGILNMMSTKSIGFMKTMSVLGYCMLPLVISAAVSVFISMNNLAGYMLGALVVLWCTLSSSAIFVTYLHLSDVRVLVAYPLALFYGVFSLLTLFQERVSSK